MDRRSALAVLLSPAFVSLWRRTAADAPEMRITRIDTVYWESRDDAPFWPHWTWLVVPHTAGGPLLFYASTHLTTAVTNVAIQESCQRFFERDWPAMLEDEPCSRVGSCGLPVPGRLTRDGRPAPAGRPRGMRDRLRPEGVGCPWSG